MISKYTLTQLAEALGGLPVYGSLPGSPAELAGIRYGDVLLSVDGQLTPSWDAYLAARHTSGSVIVLRLFRDGQEFEISLKLDRGAPVDADALAGTLNVLARVTGSVGEPS